LTASARTPPPPLPLPQLRRCAAERFWDMRELLFTCGGARNGDLFGCAAQLSLDVAVFDRDRASIGGGPDPPGCRQRPASGQVLGTPTLFIDGVVHRAGYDPPTLLAAWPR